MDRKILNIGCGNDFSYGTDFADIKPQRKDVKYCNIDTDRLDYANNTFDEVYARQLWVHLKNPDHFIEEAYRVLKHGGKLVITNDNAGFILFTKIYWKRNDNRLYRLDTAITIANWLNDSRFKQFSVNYGLIDYQGFKLDRLFMKVIGNISDKLKTHIIVIAIK